MPLIIVGIILLYPLVLVCIIPALIMQKMGWIDLGYKVILAPVWIPLLIALVVGLIIGAFALSGVLIMFFAALFS